MLKLKRHDDFDFYNGDIEIFDNNRFDYYLPII